MADNEYGPFTSERDALATRSAAVINAAYDAAPGTGATFPAALKVMTDACEAAGVELGAYDLSPLRQLSYAEIGQCVALAGIIRRAFEAGKAAALEGAPGPARGQPVEGSGLMPGKTVTLNCGTEEDAATVAAEAYLPGDLCNTARRDGNRVVITYTDKRYPLDVADWAFQNGHASDAEAANTIARL